MHPNEYQRLASVTECDQTRSLSRMANLAISQTKDYTLSQLRQIRLNHGILGLMGEVGELAAALERWVYYGKNLDEDNVAEEMGDCMWYLAELCNALGVSMERVMEANIAKLKVRYPEAYTDERATNRDLTAERAALCAGGWYAEKGIQAHREVETQDESCQTEPSSARTAAFVREGRKLEDIHPAVGNQERSDCVPQYDLAQEVPARKVMREIEERTIVIEGKKTDKPRPPDQPNPFGYEDADE